MNLSSKCELAGKRRMARMRDYALALETLYKCQSNAKTIEKWRKALKNGTSIRNIPNEMQYHLDKLGILAKSKQLKVIHITGTKGKGSVSAFVESILRRGYGYKTGLFTSPHLVHPNERIRVNGLCISDAHFADLFWRCWDRLHSPEDPTKPSHIPIVPPYFRLLTLLSLDHFIRDEVDVVILEVGIGGRCDSTNVIPHPIATGVASIGYDHCDILGYTLTEIAAEKGGIFKMGSPAYTVQQEDEAMQSLEKTAVSKGVILEDVTALEHQLRQAQVPLGLLGSFQYQNAALAMQLARAFLAKEGVKEEEGEMMLGLREAKWPGRASMIPYRQSTLFLDGAHTMNSLSTAMGWFTTTSQRPKVLIFSLRGNRNVDDHVAALFKDPAPFTHIYVVPPGHPNGDSLTPIADALARYADKDRIRCFGSVDEALDQCTASGNHDVLVTGSLYLVGYIYELLLARGILPSNALDL